MSRTKEELAGRRFGLLTVLRFHRRMGKRYVWECRCECGNTVLARRESLVGGTTVSCGCVRRKALGVGILPFTQPTAA